MRAGGGLLPPYVSAREALRLRAARFCTVMGNGVRTGLRSLPHVGSMRAVPRHASGERAQLVRSRTMNSAARATVDDRRDSRKNARAQHCVSDHAKALRVNTVESLAVMSSKHHAKRILGAGIAYAGGSWRCKARRKGVGFSSIYKVCWRFITCCFARLSAQSLATRRDQSLRRVRSRRYR